MKGKGKKGQVEEFFDDLIAFGLLAVLFLVFMLYLSSLDKEAEKDFEAAQELLHCNELLLEFLQGPTTNYPEIMPRYELALKIGDKYYLDWFEKEAEHYFSSQNGNFLLVVSPYEEGTAQLSPMITEYYGKNKAVPTNACKARMYLPLVETYKNSLGQERNFILIKLSDW